MSHIPDASKLTEAEIKNTCARYAGCVTFVDRCVGMVFDAIDRLGLASDTCVVCLSDHGTHLNEHGAFLSKSCRFTEVAETVHIIRTPDHLGAGQRFSDLVQPADLAPTVLDLAGVDVPDFMQGQSYLPLLKGEPCDVRGVAISANVPDATQDNAVITARDQRWQLQDSPDPAKRVLHDLENDPQQTVDVAADNPDVVERLHAAVVEFLKTHDSQPQIVRWFETGDKGDLAGYVARRPGYERFRAYFAHILDSGIIK